MGHLGSLRPEYRGLVHRLDAGTAPLPEDGMRKERREKQPLVPANAIDKALRIALERGKLADLLFDEGEGRGHRVLNHMIKGLTQLPAAQRALASEQVKSRFVRAALGRVRDPAAA